MTLNDAKFSIVWFKRDLRIADHEPLAKAVKLGLPILPLYVVEPDYWKLPDVSQRHWHFIHDSLCELNNELTERKAPLCIYTENIINVLESIRSRFGSFYLFSHQETGNNWTYQRDRMVLSWCKEQRIVWDESQSNGVVRRLIDRDTWSDLRNSVMRKPVILAPSRLTHLKDINLGAIPPKEDSMFGNNLIGNVQTGGRSQGLKTLQSFLDERGQRYMLTISKPGISARNCSRLSAHIAYGTLSIREIEQATHRRIKELSFAGDENSQYFVRNLSAFLSRLAWRCHFVQKLEQQPCIEYQCMHPAFEGMRENDFNDIYFEAWKKGSTGYPLVDACMRSLQQNGWITFRMRVMLVSFASYHLWLDWRKTAPFMAGLFTDYEPGIHYSQFQMQSGVTGINAVRMYNPIKQSVDQDPEGIFIKRYVPELKSVSQTWIHEPWLNLTLAKDYPLPIVDHAAAIKHARSQISLRWKSQGFKEESSIVLEKLASRKRRTRVSTKNKEKMTSHKQLEFKF